MEKSKKDALIKRAAAAAVMAPATLAVIYIGIPCFNLFVMFLGCLLAWEWAEMAASAGKKACMFPFMHFQSVRRFGRCI